jgi:membrane fusion protein
VLRLPSTAVGFIQPGQHVRVSYDAFPYQRFGQYEGTVRSVSQSDVPVAAASGNAQDQRAVFLVHVDLAKSSVKAYGTEIALRPGHTLSADIEIDTRRLIAWMLDPLLAFSGRL